MKTSPQIGLVGVVAIAALSCAQTASAQLILRSQNRYVSASGRCCNVEGQAELESETGMNAVFSNTVGVDHFQDPYNYYSADATQNTTIEPGGIRGRTAARGMARGIGAPAQSTGSSACNVMFAIEVPCTYTFAARMDSKPGSFFFQSQFSLRRPGGATVFSGEISNEQRDASRNGELAPGDYAFAVISSAPGTQLGSFAPCNFEFTLHSNCACDWNEDGALASADFFEFLVDFFAGNADFDDSGATDSQDFFGFLECFFSSCG